MTREINTDTPLHEIESEAKWQHDYIDYLSKMSDMELFEQIVEDGSGDDFDGAFTNRGWWRWCYLVALFRHRLTLLWIG